MPDSARAAATVREMFADTASGCSMWYTVATVWNMRKGPNGYGVSQITDRKCPKWIIRGILWCMDTNSRERSSFSDALAAQIRAERAAAQWSQAELSRRSGVSRVSIIRIERGERVADTTQMVRFAQAFGLPLVEFVRRAEQRVLSETTPDPESPGVE